MAWLEDEQTNGSARFLKIPNPQKKGESSRVTIRVLDSEPEGTWRHWFNRRPYNCPGNKGSCPVCRVRKVASDIDKTAAQKQYPMEHVYFFNVLSEGEVKVYTFKNAVATKLREFIHEYGDLRNYDVKVTKTKNGPLDVNIAWDVLYLGPRELTEDEQEAIHERFDLKAEVVPASYEDLEKVAKGEVPSEKENDKEVGEQESSAAEDEKYPIGILSTQQETVPASEVLAKFEAIVKQQGKNLNDYGVDPKNPPSDRILKAMIKQLED